MTSHLACSLAVLTISFSALGTRGLAAQEDATGPYDFVPGARILYAEDFQPALGGPGALRRLSRATSRMTITQREGRPFLHTKPPASFVAVLKETLPERFTIDFDMYVPGVATLRISTVGTDPSAGVIDVGPHSVAAGGSEEVLSAEADRLIPDFDDTRTMHYSITVDGRGVRIYVGKIRVLDAPKGDFGRSRELQFEFIGGDDPGLIDYNIPMWITDIRVAAGGNALSYDELMAKGRIATHGILFDSGSDRIRPESAPTLKLIGDMLSSHADLKLTIEGHTDNIGMAAANQSLSERRAEAVKQYLVSSFRIDAARLTSAGFGDTKPAVPNASAEGRQQNRRVELVKR